MKWLSARYRLSLGLVAITISVYFLAVALGLVPSGEQAIANHRKMICDRLAISSALLVDRNDYSSIRKIIDSSLERNSELKSVALRRSNNTLVYATPAHEDLWIEGDSVDVGETQVSVVIYKKDRVWGHLELKFEPFFAGNTWLSSFSHPWIQLAGFIRAGPLLAFSFYLKRMLNEVNPTKTVPSRVRSALNTFTEVIMLLDIQGRIVLANSAFEAIAGLPADELVGKKPDQFVWLDGSGRAELELPWHHATEHGQIVTDQVPVMPRIDGQIQTDHWSWKIHRRSYATIKLKPNCTPVLGENSQSNGVLVVSGHDGTGTKQTGRR